MNSRAVKRAASVIELAQGKHKKLVIMVKTDVKEGAHPGFENIRPYTSGASAISSVDPDARVPARPASLLAPRRCRPRVPAHPASLAAEPRCLLATMSHWEAVQHQQMCSWDSKITYLLFDYLILWLRQCDHSVVSPFEELVTVRTLLSGQEAPLPLPLLIAHNGILALSSFLFYVETWATQASRVDVCVPHRCEGVSVRSVWNQGSHVCAIWLHAH